MNTRRSLTAASLMILSFGAALISAGCNSGSTLTSLEQSVEDRVTGVSLDVASTEIAVSQTEILVAKISPSGAANQNVAWTSSDSTVASVSSSGLVTGLKAGDITITVTTEDGGKSASCQLKVIDPISNTLLVSISGASATLSQGNVQSLTASVSGDPGSILFSWYVNGVQVATGESYSFGSALEPSIYRIDVAAFSADGTQAGSATTFIQVEKG